MARVAHLCLITRVEMQCNISSMWQIMIMILTYAYTFKDLSRRDLTEGGWLCAPVTRAPLFLTVLPVFVV